MAVCNLMTGEPTARAEQPHDSTMGKISGKIVDETSGTPLAEAGVETVAEPGGEGQKRFFVLSNKDGFFIIEVPAGTYTITTTYPGGSSKKLTGVKVTAGARIDLTIAIAQSVVEIEELKVVGRPKADTEMVNLMKRKIAAGIMDNISAESIKKIPESDVAGILTRMPGVVMDQGKFMQARGMTKRYNNTTLNGAIVPTTRPNEKLTPLDLFPAGVVESINVVKSFTPDLPGNFSGGLCQIRTKSVPDEFIMKLGYTTKYNTATTGEQYLTYHGGKKDWLGYDDGTRKLSGNIPNKMLRRGGIFSKGFEPEELERIGESFNNTWNIHQNHARPQADYDFYIGNRYNKFGFVLSGYYKTDIQNRKNEQRTVFTATGKSGVRPDSSYQFQRSIQTIKEGGLCNFGLEITDDHKLFFNNFYNRNATDEARIYEGFNSDQNENIFVSRLRWIEEEIYSGQLAGDHAIERLLHSKIKWRWNYSFANMLDPDMRDTTYEFNDARGKYLLSNDTEAMLRMFTKQKEDMDDLAFDWGFEVPSFSWLTVKPQFGAAYTKRERDFTCRRFAFFQRDTSRIDLSKDVETILRPENINPYEIEIQETTRPTDAYKAEEKLKAFYGMIDVTFFEKLQIVGGVRRERDKTDVITRNPFKPDQTIVTKLHKNTWEPSINLKYSPVTDMNIRFGFSRTVSRPEFHELAPFEFTDVIGGSAIKGNPDLRVALIKNYDFRWEWFLNNEDMIAISAFYKDITDAIEPTLQPTTQLRESFTNAKDAWLKGVEVELRKNLGFINRRLRHFAIITNYIYTDSETEVEPSAGFVPTTFKRPLVGQPENTFNISLEYDNPDLGFTGRFMYRYTDDRIKLIGGLGLPDVIEKENDTFDIVLIQKFGKHWEIKLTCQNLNNEPYTLLQGGGSPAFNPSGKHQSNRKKRSPISPQLWIR